MPAEPFTHAQMLQWIFFEQYEHEPSLAVRRYILRLSGRPEDFADRLPELEAKGYGVLGVMERHLGGRAWFAGDAFSLADVCLYGYTHVADEGGFSLDGFPAVRAWLDRVAAEPGHVPITA